MSISPSAPIDYPRPGVETDRVEAVPRRVRGHLGGEVIFDTTHARYVWEWPYYPQYYIPVADIDGRFLTDDEHPQHLHRGTARRHSLHAGGVTRPGSVRVYGEDALEGLAGTARFDWDALDAWFEEEEQIFVHPRNPYVRVDALRSRRHLRVEIGGIVLADSHAPVLVFETGLPTRYYVDRSAVAFEHLVPSQTQTACPYKGVTSGTWSVPVGAGGELQDVAWSYDFPTAALLPIAGLVAFYNERVDLVVDGHRVARPSTHLAR